MATVSRSKTMTEWEANLRLKMKELLALCDPPEIDVFRHMYDHKFKHQNPIDAVDEIPFTGLDWAFQQIESTLRKKVEE